MRNKSLLIGIFVACSVHAAAPPIRWVAPIAGAKHEEARRIAVDGHGNCNVAGYFGSTNVTFGTFVSTNGPASTLAARFDRYGQFVWTASLTNGNATTTGITVDGDGDVYVAGHYSGFLVTNLNFGQTNLQRVGTTTESFVAKYSAAGSLQWVRQFHSTNNAGVVPYAIAAASSNVLVAFGVKGHFAMHNDSITNTDIAVVVLDRSGWLSAWTGIGPASTNQYSPYASPSDIRPAPDGGVYLSGIFREPTFALPGHTLTNAGTAYDYDIFVLKLASNLTCEWTRQIGGTNDDQTVGMCVLPDGSVVVSAGFGGVGAAAGLSVSNSGSILLRLAPNGAPMWVRQVLHGRTNGRMASDAAGNIYLASSVIQLEPELGITEYTYPAILAKFSPEGERQWFKLTQSTRIPNYPGVQWNGFLDVGVDRSGTVYTCGIFEGLTLIFGPTTLTNQGPTQGWDSFIARIDPEPPQLLVERNGLNKLISWSTNQLGFTLERATSFGALWEPVTSATNVTNGRFVLTDNSTNHASFFRLKLDE